MKITYNPQESIEENARRCGVTVYAIRKYIQRNGIDRRYDAQLQKYIAVQRLIKAKPHHQITEIAKELSLSVNTVKKYLDPNSKPSKSDTFKVSKIDTNTRTGNIISVSKNQTEILSNILRLYIHEATFDCDLTFSKGNFYKHIPIPPNRYDKYPQMDDVLPLEDALSLPDECYQSVVVDLPFIVRDGKKANSMIGQRFSAFNCAEDLFKANDNMLSLAHRLLKPKGFLVMKTMDFCFGGKQHWVSYYVQQKAHQIGFKLIDTFILISPTKILSSQGLVQRHARKYHSFFFVFQKAN